MNDGRLFSFAGIMAMDEAGFMGFSIVTTEADAQVSRVHPRMPLQRQDEEVWLEEGSIEGAIKVLHP